MSSLILFRRSRHPSLVLASLVFILASGPFAGKARAQIEDLNAPQRTITNIVSLEDEHFKVENSHLTIGRDGRVYLLSPGNPSYLMTMKPDGAEKKIGLSGGVGSSVAATKGGIIVVARPHFVMSVGFCDQDFNTLGTVPGFLGGDKYGYDTPLQVEVGRNGQIFAMDQYRNQIREVAAEGRPMGREVSRIDVSPDFSAKFQHKSLNDAKFRVDDARQRLVWLSSTNQLAAMDLKGTVTWSKDLASPSSVDAFDVDEAGNIYVWQRLTGNIQIFSPAGDPGSVLTLDPVLPDLTTKPVVELRVDAGKLYIRQADKVELVRTYDLKTGKLLSIVKADTRVLTTTFAGGVWPAGKVIPFAINYQTEAGAPAPHWRVWVRPWNGYGWTELPWKAGQLALPANLAGLYQLRVNASVDGSPTVEQIEAVVLAGIPNGDASVSLYVPSHRSYWARGEAIPFQVLLNVSGPHVSPRPTKLQLKLGDTVAWEQDCTLSVSTTLDAAIPAEVTRYLQPGKYLLTAQVDGASLAPQPIYLGPGATQPNRFQIVSFADYDSTYPQLSNIWTVADYAMAQVDKTLRLGENLIVGRLGYTLFAGQLLTTPQDAADLKLLRTQLEAVTGGPLPEIADVLPVTQQCFAAYTAFHIEQMAILLSMDASLPVGKTGFDPRPPEKLKADINVVMDAIEKNPSFRGWSWAANWWLGDAATALNDDAQKAAYKDALAAATKDGTWNDLIGQVADIRYGYSVDALKLFNGTLEERPGGRKVISALSGPYRQIAVYPPMVYGGAEEVDLHFQSEQIAPPMVWGHDVAFQKIPGKRAWGHPENYNDDGRGDETISGLFQQLMWGADGTGYGGTGVVSSFAPREDDPRMSIIGLPSVARQFNAVLSLYGPWTTGLKEADPIAILVSRRMVDLDVNFSKVGGSYFDVIQSAWQAASYCGRPAKYIFLEYAKDVDWKQFQAVLMIDQTVEPEPEYKATLASVQQAGVPVYYDASCRSDWGTGAKPLGFAFDDFKPIETMFNSDLSYYLYTPYMLGLAGQLSNVLKDVVKPIAISTDPTVVMTERTAGKGRFFYVLNQRTVEVPPGRFARVSTYAGTRVPQTANITVDPQGGVLYDVFARKQVTDPGGTVHLDLRDLPAGILAALPEAIGSVRLTPAAATPGQKTVTKVEVLGASGQPLDTSLPVYCTVRNGNGDLLEERFLDATQQGADFNIDVPKNLPAGGLKINALDLVSGHEATAAVAVDATGGAPANGGIPAWSRVGTPPHDADTALAKTILPVNDRFGPKVRDMVLSPDGKTVLLSALNYGDNVFAMDPATGKPLWSNRIANWFAYQPSILGGDFGAMGYDWWAPEGYFYYRLGADGQPTKRYAVPGLGRRIGMWIGAIKAEDNTAHVAIPPDGSWIAASGNLGLMVWSAEGKLLWKEDSFKDRKAYYLIAPNSSELWLCDGMNICVVKATTGKEIWKQKFGNDGAIQNATTDHAGKTVALVTTTRGGAVLVIRNGKVLKEFRGIEEIAKLSPDGDRLARIRGPELAVYNFKDNTSWNYRSDEALRNPAFAEDGRLFVSSALGTVLVFQPDGSIAWKKDQGALACASWLSGGDLLMADFMGDVQRISPAFQTLWETRLKQRPFDGALDLDRKDETPAADRITGWSNAEATPAPITPNLLHDMKGGVNIFLERGNNPFCVVWEGETGGLSDGNPTPPKDPIISLPMAGMNESGWFGKTYLEIDLKKDARVDGMTFFEDPDHPESWVRDVALEYYDKAKDSWLPAGTFLSDQAVHTHKLATPVTTSKLRLVAPTVPNGGAWLMGNLRLGELVIQGQPVP